MLTGINVSTFMGNPVVTGSLHCRLAKRKSMVQLKYFGDNRDYFKYDLITYLLNNGILSRYAFIPMLTNNRIDEEGNKTPKHVKGKSTILLSFIDRCTSKDLEHWEEWLRPYTKSYITINPVNKTFFNDDARDKYWHTFESVIKQKNALIFIDPDTGLETGSSSYLRKMGREKYILNNELTSIYEHLAESSALMIYQHLSRNRHNHEESVLKKLKQTTLATNNPLVLAYREDDLAFIFIMKNNAIYTSLYGLLSKYHKISGHIYKSIHYTPNK